MIHSENFLRVYIKYVRWSAYDKQVLKQSWKQRGGKCITNIIKLNPVYNHLFELLAQYLFTKPICVI